MQRFVPLLVALALLSLTGCPSKSVTPEGKTTYTLEQDADAFEKGTVDLVKKAEGATGINAKDALKATEKKLDAAEKATKDAAKNAADAAKKMFGK